jgi:DNA topoisomerase VI subunit A
MNPCSTQVLEKIEELIGYIISELSRGCSPKLHFSARCRENTVFDNEKRQIVFKNGNEQHKVTVNFQLSPKQFGK